MPRLKPTHISPGPVKIALPKEQFDEIAAKYGEEVAIQAGIARDPDTFEADDEWFQRARPGMHMARRGTEL